MNITTVAMSAVATVASAVGIGIAAPPTSSGDSYPIIQKFGTEENLVDDGGAVVQGWTVSNLQSSTDSINYPIRGKLWEATATDRAVEGTVIPFSMHLNARAPSGQNYPNLAWVAAPQMFQPGDIGQGQERTGKVYFDVTGQDPDGVVYIAGARDLLFWVK
jgi:hypothetical protein